MASDDNHSIDNGRPVEGPAEVSYIHEPSLEPELRLIEGIFSNQINQKKSEATDKLEAGQNQVKILDKLLGIINLSNTPEGMELADELKNLLNGQWDYKDFEQTQKSKDLLTLLKAIKEAIESESVPNFQPLFAFLSTHPDSSMNTKLESLGIVDGVQPTPEQIKEFADVIAEKEAKNNSREYRKNQHEKFLQLLKDSGIIFQAEPYSEANFQNLFNTLANTPEHPLNAKLAEIGILPGQKPTAEQLKMLVDSVNGDETAENREIRKLLRDEKIIAMPESFTRQQTENILHQIRGSIKEKEAFNNVESRKISELDAQMNKMYQSLMSCVKTLHEIVKKIASSIRGG